MSFRLEYPRIHPLRRPIGFTPGAPKFEARWDRPMAAITSEYLAIQHKPEPEQSRQAETFVDRVKKSFDDECGPDCFEVMNYTDSRGLVNAIVVAYWLDQTRYSAWRLTNSFNAWFDHHDRQADDVGYWRELIAVPFDRFETIFSEAYYKAGVARAEGCALESMYTAGYFGAMRDRLPVAAIDELASPYDRTVPACAPLETEGRRFRICPPQNVVSIRSGQYWQQAETDQLTDYLANLQPKLDNGVKYLQDNRAASGCLHLRSMVNVDGAGRALRETSKHGYFLSLGHLENWAASHESHLKIFEHALAMRRQYGADRSVVTWHEVFVTSGAASMEYVNCHADTGLLHFAPIWGYELRGHLQASGA